MSFVITPGVNQGFPYISGIPVPTETPVLIKPYPNGIFCSAGGELPSLLPLTGTRLTFSEMYSAENAVNSLYFGENEVQAAYFNDTEVFRVHWF